MTKTKKIIIISSMVFVLAAAIVLNVLLTGSGNNQNDDNVVASGNFFETYRNNRQQTRAEEIVELEAVIALVGDEYEEARAEAIEQKLKLVELMETELTLESLIKAKGYEDVVVNMGIYSDNINIMVKCDNLTRSDTAVIYGVVASETNVAPEMIKIIPV